MSLLVYLIAKKSGLELDEYEEELQRPDLFGPEKWKSEVWGSEFIKNLGCSILPKLAKSNIYAFDDELEELINELNLLLKNLEKYNEPIDYDTFLEAREVINIPLKIRKHNIESIQDRILNAIEVTRVAKKYKNKLGVAIN